MYKFKLTLTLINTIYFNLTLKSDYKSKQAFPSLGQLTVCFFFKLNNDIILK